MMAAANSLSALSTHSSLHGAPTLDRFRLVNAILSARHCGTTYLANDEDMTVGTFVEVPDVRYRRRNISQYGMIDEAWRSQNPSPRTTWVSSSRETGW